MSCRAEKRTVKINHTEESFKSSFIHGRRKIKRGGMLRQSMQAGTGEAVSKELGLRYGELALAHANRQAMGVTQLQEISEMLNMRS